MLTLPEEALARLHGLLSDTPVDDLVRRLYGAAWTDVVTRSRSGEWRANRYPHPGDLSSLLVDVLQGVIAHDGRSTRTTTASGWWARGIDGWAQTTAEEISDALKDAVAPLVDEAVAVRVAGRTAADRARRLAEDAPRPLGRVADDLRGAARSADASHRDASIRAAVLSSLRAALAAQGRLIPSTLRVLRPRLPLPSDALGAIARGWLDEQLDLDRLTPDAAGRITTADVHDLIQPQGEDGLPTQALFRGLDDLLGPRQRSARARFWVLPEDWLDDEPGP